MKKVLLTLTLTLTSLVGFSQTLWHSPDDCLLLPSTGTTNATYTAAVTNPSFTGTNTTAANVSSVLASANNGQATFTIPTFMPGESITLSLKYFTATTGGNNLGSGRFIVRIYNATLGAGSGTTRVGFTTVNKVGGAWQNVTETLTLAPNTDVTNAGGYNSMVIIASNNALNDASIENLYFDDIELNKVQPTATVLPGTPTLVSGNSWVYNQGTNNLNATVSALRADATVEATPTTSGNSAANVLKITRTEANANSGVIMTLDNSKYFNGASGTLKFRIYPNCKLNTNSNVKIRVNKDGAQGDFQISYPTENLVQNKWNEVSIDLASSTPTNVADNQYNTIILLFNQGDSSEDSNGAVFYMDALQTPTATTLSTNSFDLKSFQVFPNPTADSFQISTEETIKSVILTNATGQVVKTFTSSENYNISDLNAGIYFATVSSDNGSQTVKIVKK